MDSRAPHEVKTLLRVPSDQTILRGTEDEAGGMSGTVIEFPNNRPMDTSARRLWDLYMLAIADFHRALPELDIEKMRACVMAYDEFFKEFTKEK